MSETKEDGILSVKTVLIGDSGVGKTSIIKQFVKNTFDPDISSSISGQYSSKAMKISEKDMQFDIWDTAGQEQYRSLAKLFYKDAKIIIFVYDITNPKSFEDIKKYWYQQIKANSREDAILALVGNKNDMFENEKVDESEARQYAESIGAIFQKVSAKSISTVKDLFKLVGKKFLDPNYDYKKEEEKDDKLNSDKTKNEKMFNNDIDVDTPSVKLHKNKVKKSKQNRCC